MQFGPQIYSAIQEDSNNNLQYSVELGKQRVERYRQDMIRDAVHQAEVASDRFQNACFRNPSLPGCNDLTNNRIPEYANPLAPPAGELACVRENVSVWFFVGMVPVCINGCRKAFGSILYSKCKFLCHVYKGIPF
jgi:hypothetical protein